MDFRKRILLDLFTAPSTLLPVIGGLGLLVGGWALGAGATIAYVGVAGIVAGLGIAAARLLFGLEKITERAYQYAHDQEWKKQDAALDKLDHKLIRDRDPRTQTALREVRRLYAGLVEDVKAGRITRNTNDILERFESLFRACVARLQQSYELWDAARRMPDERRDEALQQREALVEEVSRSTAQLDHMIGQLRSFADQPDEPDLGSMRAELDEAIEVARRTEERLASWGKKPYDEKEFE